MHHIEQLLDDLNAMLPISASFRIQLSPILKEKNKSNNYIFLKAGKQAKKGWQLLSGFILAIRTDANENNVVVKIYTPRQMVTDLPSFFQGHAVRYTYIGVGQVKVLEIKKKNFIKLHQHEETNKLVNHITFLERDIEAARAEILVLPDRERIISFFAQYPVTDLPDVYCASFLRIPIESYMELKVELLAQQHLKLIYTIKEVKKEADRRHLIYEIKSYLIQNHDKPEIYSNDRISRHFGIEKKALNRAFVKAFGITINQFVVKFRMDKAHELLSVEHRSVGQVALILGYKDIYTFSRAFKNHYHYPPGKLKLKLYSVPISKI